MPFSNPRSDTDHSETEYDCGLVTGAVFLDQHKAFDTLDHSLLVRKPKSLGSQDSPWNGFRLLNELCVAIL